MKFYKCDQCKRDFLMEPVVELTGFKPDRRSGILLVERGWHFTFCEPAHFIDWMKEALEDDSRAG